MKRYVAFVAVFAMALVLVAMPAYAISGVNGTATTDNTILQVKVGSTLVRLASDVAESLNTSTLKATSSFLSGQVGDIPIPGGASKTATKSSESGSTAIGNNITKTVPGLASIKLQGGEVAANISNTKVSSVVDFAVGQVNALAGFTTIGTTSSSTDSSVGVNSSTVSRDVSIGDINVLNLRDLLDQLGVDPLAMACDDVANTASELGQDASAACATLTSVTNSITDVTGEVDNTETVIATLETALAPLCALAPAGTCDTITAQIDALQSDIDDFQADPATACAAMDDAIATISGSADTVVTTLNGLSGGALGDLSLLISPVTTQLGVLDTALATMDSTCNQLLGIIDDLLDTSLLSLDLINVAMDLAADSSPSAVAAGNIGALKVGSLSVVDANDLEALGAKLNDAIDTVESKLGAVFAATGLGLSAPSLDLLKVTSSKGKNSAGYYFANAALTAAHLGVPSAVVNIPASLPLDVLSGLGSFAPATVRTAAVTTPAVSVDAGVFSGSATFKAGSVLPVTGVADSGLVFAGMLTLIGAGMVRRIKTLFY
jgi:hypothetical protein